MEGNMGRSELPQRKRLAHVPPVERHDQPVILFVTLTVQPRGKFLASELIHTVFREACHDADAWLVGRYVIMPDHIHLFSAPARWPAVGVQRWARFLKERITKRLGTASPPRAEAARGWRWQSDCWDTQMRSGEKYHEKWLYVRENPVRAGLVENAEKWNFQGELNVLLW
jgi:REP element-mobilizing transposase RayT